MEQNIENQSIIHQTPPPLVKISGSHREVGQQIGEACRKQVRHSIEGAQWIIEKTSEKLKLKWDDAVNQVHKYMPYAQERYPQYIDEIKGISEGANVNFDDVCVVNAMEEITTDALHLEKCTSFAVNESLTEDGHVLAAHNEDWLPGDEEDVFVLHVSLDDEPPFLALTYGALLPNIGLNACGISQSCNSVYPNDARIGIPRVVVSRAVLACKSPADAIRCVTAPRRAAGYNHLLAHESGELYNIEVSAKQFAILYGKDGYVVHTNNFLDDTMKKIEAEPEELVGSQTRYFRALRLLTQTPKHTVSSLQSIQRDHVNSPGSICSHAIDDHNPLDSSKTISSLVMDLSDRVMYLAWGSPCKNQYHTFYLNEKIE